MIEVIKSTVERTYKNKSIRFILTVLFLFIFWKLSYQLWLEQSLLNAYLAEALGESTNWFFSLLGQEITLTNTPKYSLVSLNGMKALSIGVPCTGLEFFGLFACFVIAFPAPIKSKLSILPLGILLIHFLNLIRIQVLILNYHYFNTSFDFNHKVTFNIVVYGVILLIWVKWAKYQMIKTNEKSI